MFFISLFNDFYDIFCVWSEDRNIYTHVIICQCEHIKAEIEMIILLEFSLEKYIHKYESSLSLYDLENDHRRINICYFLDNHPVAAQVVPVQV